MSELYLLTQDRINLTRKIAVLNAKKEVVGIWIVKYKYE